MSKLTKKEKHEIMIVAIELTIIMVLMLIAGWLVLEYNRFMYR